VLALCAMSPKNAAGQQQQPRGQKSRGSLGQSYPNPSNPDFFQPFGVDADVCTDGSQQHVVSLRAYNILGQPVGTFVVRDAAQASTTIVPSALRGQRISNLRL